MKEIIEANQPQKIIDPVEEVFLVIKKSACYSLESIKALLGPRKNWGKRKFLNKNFAFKSFMFERKDVK